MNLSRHAIKALCVMLPAMLTSGCSYCVLRDAPSHPADWVAVEAPDRFTLALPPDYVEQEVQGIDSYVRCFQSGKVRLGLDYGRYSDPLTSYADRPEYESGELTLGNRDATWVSFALDEAEAPSADPLYRHFVAMHVPRAGFTGRSQITLHARCADRDSMAEAMRIFKTVRFR